MDDLRKLWAAGRLVYNETRDRSYDESNAAHTAHGVELLAWAATVDTARAPQSLEEAVRVAFAKVVTACKATGANPGWEVFCQPPEAEGWKGAGSWRVCWESGPHDWAIGDSMGAGEIIPGNVCSGSGWFTEPYYGFDLCFVTD
jgi:hypothetical protein